MNVPEDSQFYRRNQYPANIGHILAAEWTYEKGHIVGGSYRVTLVVEFGFLSQDYGNVAGFMNVICHSVNVDRVV